MIATAMAALHGDELGKVVVVSGSAGAPNATAPSPRAIQLATTRRPNGSMNDLEVASLLFDVNSTEGLPGSCSAKLTLSSCTPHLGLHTLVWFALLSEARCVSVSVWNAGQAGISLPR